MSERALLRQVASTRGPIPAFIVNAPELEVGLDFLYNSFLKLSSCRPPGFSGIGEIPWTAISQYCKDYDIRGEDQEDFEYVIVQLDDAYRKHINDKAEAERKKAPPPRKVARRR